MKNIRNLGEIDFLLSGNTELTQNNQKNNFQENQGENKIPASAVNFFNYIFSDKT